jgi:hypothetical protein
VSDIDIAVVDSLKVLDPKWPIREADVAGDCVSVAIEPETDVRSGAQVGIVTLPRASIPAHIRLANGRFIMVYPVVPSMNEARAGFEIS